MTYPEHDKLTAISDQSQTIGEFLDWCGQDRNWFLAKYDPAWHADSPCALRVTTSTQNILAEYFGIDLGVLEDEKQEMLAKLRETN